jgi:hypothetical protein
VKKTIPVDCVRDLWTQTKMMTPFDERRECGLLESLMFSLYEYGGNTPENPLSALVDEHFERLSQKYPSMMLRVTVPVDGQPMRLGILPCDFVDNVISEKTMQNIIWRVSLCTSWYPPWVV